MTEHLNTLAQWRQQLEQVRDQQRAVHDFSSWARARADLLAALPPQYGQVLHNLLDRLEAGALFTEESCSFSQKDLLDNLQTWAAKAEQALQA